MAQWILFRTSPLSAATPAASGLLSAVTQAVPGTASSDNVLMNLDGVFSVLSGSVPGTLVIDGVVVYADMPTLALMLDAQEFPDAQGTPGQPVIST